MCGNYKFFNENDKNKLMNQILNTNCGDEDDIWNLALTLESISIRLRKNVLEKSNDR